MLWGVLWRSENRLDGKREWLMYDNCLPLLFRRRRDARTYIGQHYGYIKERPDLVAEPHGWKVPIPVKVIITEQR